MCAVGCGGESAPASTAGAPSSTAVTTGTTSPTSGSTALTALQPFFAAAQRMDGQLAAAGARINGTVGPSTITMDPTIIDVIMTIDDRALAQRVPGGLDDDLLRAVLTVYDDLSVRRASLGGYGHFLGKTTPDSREGQDLLRCLSDGADPAAHFAEDLARAKTLASARSVTVATPGSRASAEVAVRLAWLRLGHPPGQHRVGRHLHRVLSGAAVSPEGHLLTPGPPARSQRPHLVALVRAGARFEKGRLVERPEQVVISRLSDTADPWGPMSSSGTASQSRSRSPRKV